MKTIYAVSDIQKVEYIEEKIHDHINATKQNFKNKTEKVLNDVDIDDIISCIAYLYMNRKSEKLDNLLNLTGKLENNIKYRVLEFLIKNGISYSKQYAKNNKLNTKKIDKMVYLQAMESLTKIYYTGEVNEFLEEYWGNMDTFLDMYGNKEELAIEFGKKGFIEHYSYLRMKIPNLKKFNPKESLEILKSFGIRVNDIPTINIIYLISLLNWNTITENIFSDNKENLKKIKNILKLNKDEIKESEELKNEIFYEKYEHKIELEKQKINLMNFKIIDEISFSSEIETEENNKILENSLKEINLFNNGGNEFKIDFISIYGETKNFKLKRNKDNTENIYNTYYDFNTFSNDIIETNKEYIENLEDNDIDYTIIISKSIGNEKPDPEEDNEVINFSASNEEYYKLAA